MDKWTQPGQFSLSLPESWTISQTAKLTELVPGSGDAAIHISSFSKREPSPPTCREAIALVENFANNNSLEVVTAPTCKTQPNECSCIGRYRKAEGGSGPMQWILKSSVGLRVAAVASLCSDDQKAQSSTEGQSILETLVVDENLGN
jgi:hypothetical protein